MGKNMFRVGLKVMARFDICYVARVWVDLVVGRDGRIA